MLAPILLFVTSLQSADPPADPRKGLDKLLDLTDRVSFYYVNQMGRYDFSAEETKTNASIVVQRECGSNCRRYMKEVVSHLMIAIPVTCSNGQQDLLIEFSGGHISYSHSGKAIEFQGSCFHSNESIHSITRNERFIFD